MDIDPFLIRAALAGLGTSIAAALLGCFVVWRRMAYFGDATAHAGILGVALAIWLEVSITAGVLATALVMALALYRLEAQGREVNSSLGVLAHGALASGLVLLALIPGGTRVPVDSYLFGDVLTVSWEDVAWLWGRGAFVVAVLWWNWSALLVSTLNPDLAVAAGVRPERQKLLLAALLAFVVAMALKVVGALLITALLIMPAASARGLARTPEGMAVVAVIFGALAAVGGLGFALWADTPAGPTIVCTAAGLFAVSLLKGVVR